LKFPHPCFILIDIKILSMTYIIDLYRFFCIFLIEIRIAPMEMLAR
jgi:hypothetical protein